MTDDEIEQALGALVDQGVIAMYVDPETGEFYWQSTEEIEEGTES